MKKIKLSKVLMELSLALISYLFYLLILPIMSLLSKFYKRKIYVLLENGHNIELFVFNTECNLIKYLPLTKAILQRKIFLVGIDLDTSSRHDFTPGLISLYNLRTLSGINHVSVEDVNQEYMKYSSVVFDIKLAIRFLLASFFLSRRKIYLNHLNLMGVRFMNTTMQDAVELIKHKIQSNEKSNMYFINADTLNKTYKQVSLRHILNKTDYVLPDGSGIKMASNMVNMPLKQNINGTDMFPFLCKMAEEEKIKIFLYGAKLGVAEQMKEKILQEFPKLEIVGAINGYDFHDNEVINMMNHSKAELVFVARGAPLQEEWIDMHSNRISASVIMGVGGLFDFYSGNIPRSPIWIREIGMEWVYRLFQEPKRMWKRYILGNPLFLSRIYLWDKKQKKERLQKYYETSLEERRDSFVEYASLLLYRFYPIAKRMLDVFLTFIAVLVLGPLMLMVAIAIRTESKGNVLFSHARVGRDGKLFKMYKFRSMVQNAESLKKDLVKTNESKDGVIFKMKDDPRITKIGKFIRKWSIDELPQLFNVLKGDMSLVGPRPPVPSEVAEYISDDLKRLHITPGITCYWQVSGRSEIPFKQQVALDKKYIATRSMWVDIKILLATVPAVLAKKGAY
jgi:exopolysaccharide biosynthesis WecB/TagA/CpsF family protein